MQDLIDVRFCLDGLPAPEYADPNDLGTGHRVTRYIEVVAGQCFNINVRVLQNFSLRFAPELYVKLEVDNQETYMYSHLSCKGLKHSRGRLQQDHFITAFLGRKAWDDLRGRWTEYKYQVGALGLSGFSLSITRKDH
jgi:hypothetical protein